MKRKKVKTKKKKSKTKPEAVASIPTPATPVDDFPVEPASTEDGSSDGAEDMT